MKKSSTRSPPRAGSKAAGRVRPRPSASVPLPPPTPETPRVVSAERAFLALTAAAVAAGLYARFAGLGRWPVSFDEYFIGKSVRSILAYGVPRFGESGYYVRGILMQYFQAAVCLTGAGEEFSLRIIPALFNVVAMPAVWLLGRKLSGRAGAALAVTAFALSSWEIEFARFARMYAPFQALFLWFVYILHGIVAEGRETWRWRLYGLAFMGIFVHESAVFMAVLLPVPLVSGKVRGRASDVATILAILAAAYFVNAHDFRGMGPTPGLAAAGTLDAVTRKLLLPALAVALGPGSTAWRGALVILLVAAGAVIVRTARDGRISRRGRAILVLAVLLCLANLFAAAILLIAVALLFGWVDREDLRWDRARFAAAFAIFALVFWTSWMAALPEIGRIYAGAGKARILASLFLGWPDLYGRVLFLWLGVLPVFCALTAGLHLYAAWAGVSRQSREETEGMGTDREPAGTRLIAAVVLAVCSLVAVLKTPYASTRYTFLVFPLLLLVDVAILAELSRRLAGRGTRSEALLAGLFAAFLLLSGDVRARHLFRADDPGTNFRKGFSWHDLHHYIPRIDYRTPADFVDANRREGDRVASTLLQADFYLDKPMDFFYIDAKSPEFRNHSGPGGRERWTGAGVLSREDTLHGMLSEPGRTTWLIAGSESYAFNRDLNRKLAERYAAGRCFTSPDGSVAVYKLPPQESGTDISPK